MITTTEWLYWTASMGFCFIALNVPRMPVYWEREIESYMPMYIPKPVFFPVWVITLFARAAYGALFFQNTVSTLEYDWVAGLWWAATGILIFWIWTSFTPVTFYLAGPFGTLWFGCELANLILIIIYGDTRAWVIGFVALALAVSLVAMVCGWIVTIKLAAKFGIMKDAVARLTEQTIDNARALDQGETLATFPGPEKVVVQETTQSLIRPPAGQLSFASVFQRPAHK
jgi:hypothetical protein